MQRHGIAPGRSEERVNERGAERAADALPGAARRDGLEPLGPAHRAHRPPAHADLLEWDYGNYEGRRSVDIRAERPGWDLFRDGCPGGENAADVAVRADRVIAQIRETAGDVLIFSSSHFMRVLAARWLGLAPQAARAFVIDTASLGALGYEHSKGEPAVHLWNDTNHLI